MYFIFRGIIDCISICLFVYAVKFPIMHCWNIFQNGAHSWVSSRIASQYPGKQHLYHMNVGIQHLQVYSLVYFELLKIKQSVDCLQDRPTNTHKFVGMQKGGTRLVIFFSRVWIIDWEQCISTITIQQMSWLNSFIVDVKQAMKKQEVQCMFLEPNNV